MDGLCGEGGPPAEELLCLLDDRTRGVHDDGIRKLGVEKQPISTDPTINNVEEAEYRTTDGIACGRTAEPSPGVETREGPPGHDRVLASNDAFDHHFQAANVAPKTLDVGYQTGSSRRAAECLVCLVHHVFVGQVIDQFEPTLRDNVFKIRVHQRLWLHFSHPRQMASGADTGDHPALWFARASGCGPRRVTALPAPPVAPPLRPCRPGPRCGPVPAQRTAGARRRFSRFPPMISATPRAVNRSTRSAYTAQPTAAVSGTRKKSIGTTTVASACCIARAKQ